MGVTAATDLANSGPTMRLAPSLMASRAAAAAPSGVPLSSLISSCKFGLSRSKRASSPACFRALPIRPGWPCADREASSATLTGAAFGAASAAVVAEVASVPGALLAQPRSRRQLASAKRPSPPWPTEAPAHARAPLILGPFVGSLSEQGRAGAAAQQKKLKWGGALPGDSGITANVHEREGIV